MDVMTFDLDNNGKTQVIPPSSEKQKLAISMSLDDSKASSVWKDAGVQYVVKIDIKNNKLSATTLSVGNGIVKAVNDIPLTGTLSSDRRRIHQLADLFHKDFFATDGIASTHILYSVRSRENSTTSSKWTAEIWECDYDGANAHQVTHLNNYAITPIYVPSKKGYSSGSFLFVSYQIGQPKIFTASLRDGVGQRLSYLRGNQLMPTISPKRDKIAFVSDVAGNADLFLQSFDPDVGPLGKPRQIFSAYRATQGTPTFSPDGKRIAFVSNKDGSPRVYILDIAERAHEQKNISPVLVTKKNRENTCPSWSPDGKMLTYSSKVDGVRQIYVYDFITNEEHQLTTGDSHKENPSWAPNSLHIVFNSVTPFSNDLYLINLNKPVAMKISEEVNEQCFPCWEPITR